MRYIALLEFQPSLVTDILPAFSYLEKNQWYSRS